MINVRYDGTYPNTCSGELIIEVNDVEVYRKRFCCTSTGCATFDGDWNENIIDGELTWDDASDFDKSIQLAVRDKLSEFKVCCGGCI